MTAPPLPVEGRLTGMDFEAHNAEVRALWDAFKLGANERIPIIVGTTTRYFIDSPDANPEGIDFRVYTEDADVMFDAQLRFAAWSKANILQDEQLGIPDKWTVSVDFQNYWEPAWLGCPVEYLDGNVPDTRPAFADCPERVMENGVPDPFGGILARGLEYHERFVERASREDFLGRPIEVLPPWYGVGYNGPLTVACGLFGPDWICTAMAVEEERAKAVLTFITEATVQRMTAWRRLCGVSIPEDNCGGMDDSIALISVPMFRSHILPHLRRLYDTFGTDLGRAIHLCGDATRHFPVIRDELVVTDFDTGFPVDHGRLREQLGPDVVIRGGPHVELLRAATPADAAAETRRILESGVKEGGRFVLREGNNLAPGTPLENTEAMYEAGRRFGRLKEVP